MIFDEDGVPVAWEHVTLGDDLEAFCDAVAAGDMDAVEAIVGRAYQRAYARLGAHILEAQMKGEEFS